MSAIIEKGNTFYFPVCNTCKHYLEDKKCEAFAEIPDEILTGESIHKNVLPNQTNDIVYERREQ